MYQKERLNVGTNHKQIESLVLAVYRVTGKLPEGEVLRQKIRDESLNLVTHVEYLEQNNSAERHREFLASVYTLTAYFDIAQHQKWVDDQNFALLKDAFLQFSNTFEQVLQYSGKEESAITQNNKKGNNKPQKNSSNRGKPGSASNKRKSGVGARLSSRQKEILDTIKKHGALRARDITAEFSNVSNRTVRRELDKLVKAKLVKRDGKTNGALYSPNQQ